MTALLKSINRLDEHIRCNDNTVTKMTGALIYLSVIRMVFFGVKQSLYHAQIGRSSIPFPLNYMGVLTQDVNLNYKFYLANFGHLS